MTGRSAENYAKEGRTDALAELFANTLEPQSTSSLSGAGHEHPVPPHAPESPAADSTAAEMRHRDDSQESLPRMTIAGYQLLREISRGGQAVVFEAVQQSTGRHVAVKVLKDGPLASVKERARLDREVQILAALNHPDIVQILDRGTTAEGAFYIIMEYIPGRPLDQYIDSYREKSSGSDPSELLRLFLRICDAVNAAHLRGIVHRDLKPSNIRVDSDGNPHVLDFGLARAPMSTRDEKNLDDPITLSGEFLGSLPWASPEQADGNNSSIDARTDVYSLGVILYQMLTGRFPYDVAGNMRDVLHNILTAQPVPPSQILAARAAREANRRRRHVRRGTAVNPVIEAIVLKALSKSRSQRYQTAGELARDMGNYLSGLPTVAWPIESRSGINTRWVVMMATVALLSVIAVMAFGPWRGKRNDIPAGKPMAERGAVGEMNLPPSPRGVKEIPQQSSRLPTANVPAVQSGETLSMDAASSRESIYALSGNLIDAGFLPGDKEFFTVTDFPTRRISVWNADSSKWEPEVVRSLEWGRAIAVAPRGNFAVLSFNTQAQPFAWDLATGEKKYDMDWLRTGNHFVMTDDRRLCDIDQTTFDVRYTDVERRLLLKTVASPTENVALSADGSLIAMISFPRVPNDHFVRLTDNKIGAMRWQTKLTKLRTRMVFSPDGNYLLLFNPVSPFFDRDNVDLIATDSGTVVSCMASGNVNAVAFSPDSTTFALAVDDPKDGLSLWSVKGENLKRFRKFEGTIEPVLAVDFSSDGRKLAAGFKDASGVFDVITGLQLDHGNGPGPPMSGGSTPKTLVRFSHNGDRMIAGGGFYAELRSTDFSRQPD